MEAAAPPPAGPAATTGSRWPAILVAIVFMFIVIFFIAVSVSLAGEELCSEAAFGAECTLKSSGNRAATVVLGALAGLAALWTVFVSVGVLRGTRGWSAVVPPALVAVVLGVVVIIL